MHNNNLQKLKNILLSDETVSDKFQGLTILTDEEEYNNYLPKFSDVNNLIRGYKDIEDFNYAVVDPSKRNRTTLQKTNDAKFRHLLMNTYPSWSKYPSRSNSIFMMVNSKHDDIKVNFKSLYKVFPLKNTILGFCPDDVNFYNWTLISDIFINFGIGGRNLTPFSLLNTIMPNDIYTDLGSWENRNDLDSIFIKSTDDLSHLHNNKSIYKLVLYIQSEVEDKYNNSLSNYLNEELFNPDKNGFKLFSSNDKIPINKTGEVWSGSECLLKSINF